ncbi:hypothetical protein FACS1894190_06970 [Spirochaetia bacterium]|nr:hypothetical protein FACS1894190_06970 [Spirochaetia bacterium]
MRYRGTFTLAQFLSDNQVMLTSKPCSISCVETEYRIVCESLFPPKGLQDGEVPSIKAAQDFSRVLGIEPGYIKLVNEEKTGDGDFDHFLLHFENNLALLISKTWVEKTDEIRKERLQARLPQFISKIKKSDWSGALQEFGEVLEELAFLFFGVQSEKEDFIEYTLRIDTQMGLFWWYGCCIRQQKFPKNAGAILRALLLIGVCYLAEF